MRSGDSIFVRDSKYLRRNNPFPKEFISPTLKFTPDEWQAFILGVKAGEFDFGL